MWVVLCLTLTAFAAWPDSFEHRIAAMEALRYDFAMPGIPHNESVVLSKYKVACDKGYFDVCHPEEWVSAEESDALAAAAFMQKKCTKSNSPLPCVVVGMANGMKDGRVSLDAPNPQKAYQAFNTACEKKAYAPGCTYLGDMFRDGVAVEQDRDKARAYYEEACKAKDVWGCHRLADILEDFGAETETRLGLYKQSCQSGYELGCMAQATMMMSTAKSDAEWAFVAQQLDRGCGYGQLDKCATLATLYHQGKGGKRSLALAQALYQSTCSGGIAASCHAMGTLYLDMRPPNFTQAAKTFFDACEGGYSPSCTRYGALALKGEGVTQNTEFALRYMNKGCDSGDLEGCLVMADAYANGTGIERDVEKAKMLAGQTCDAGFGQGCYVLAQIAEGESTWGQESSLDSEALYAQSCELGYGIGCAEIALRAFSNGNADQTVRDKLELGCSGGDTRACLALGRIFAGDPAKAVVYMETACEAQSMDGCMNVGTYWQQQQELSKAANYYDKVCSFGDDRGCRALEPIAFQGRFDGLVQQAWLSNLCQVWGDGDDGLRLLAEGSGATMQLHTGQYIGSTVTVWHLGNKTSLDGVQRGESRWNMGGKLPNQETVWETGEELDHTQTSDVQDDPWGAEQAMDWDLVVTHVEEWDPSKGEITRDFPGDKAVAFGDKGVIQYSRNTELLYGQCGYTGGYSTIKTEHCSDIQSLLLGYALMDCSVKGQPNFEHP